MSTPNDDMEMEKIAEDELSKLQRQVSLIFCYLHWYIEWRENPVEFETTTC